MNLFRKTVHAIKRLELWLQDFTNALVHRLGHGRYSRVVVFVSVPLALAVYAYFALQPKVYKLPIFDAQVHYNQNSWYTVTPRAVVNTAQELDIRWMLLASTPNTGTWKIYQEDRDHVIPMLVPYIKQEDRDSWFSNPKIDDYINSEISLHPYRGIGEFFLYDGQVNTPIVKNMLRLASEKGLVLHTRSDPNAIRQMYALAPTVKILWAHAGIDVRPETLDTFLYQYPNLFVDLSLRVDVAPDGKLAPEWRRLLLRYPDKFLVGSGTYNSHYWYRFRELHEQNRSWLNQLPSATAKQIAYQNGLKLFRISFDE